MRTPAEAAPLGKPEATKQQKSFDWVAGLLLVSSVVATLTWIALLAWAAFQLVAAILTG
jgi:hypothetical protein